MITLPAAASWIAASVPATPDAQEAREAAKEELSKQVYSTQPSLWSQLWRWLHTHLDPVKMVPGAPPWLSYAIVLAALAALIVILIVLSQRASWRVARRRRTSVLFDDVRDAASLESAANTAAASGDWARAVVERFRAIIRSLDERGALTDFPGMTAQEATIAACRALPAMAAELTEAGRLFDAVRYGEVVSTASQDAWMRRLSEAVAATPVVPEDSQASPERHSALATPPSSSAAVPQRKRHRRGLGHREQGGRA